MFKPRINLNKIFLNFDSFFSTVKIKSVLDSNILLPTYYYYISASCCTQRFTDKCFTTVRAIILSLFCQVVTYTLNFSASLSHHQVYFFTNGPCVFRLWLRLRNVVRCHTNNGQVRTHTQGDHKITHENRDLRTRRHCRCPILENGPRLLTSHFIIILGGRGGECIRLNG
jgi:hypothetical protein